MSVFPPPHIDPNTHSPEDDSTHQGWIQRLAPGKTNCVLIRSEDGRFVLHLDEVRNDRQHPKFADGQEALQELLRHLGTTDSHPLVTFRVIAGTKAVYDVAWSSDNAKSTSDATRYLAALTAECRRAIQRGATWEEIERRFLRGLDDTLQQMLRGELLKLLDYQQLSEAWSEAANQSLIKQLHPQWAMEWQHRGAINQILEDLGIHAVDLEIRDDRIQEIAIVDGFGKELSWNFSNNEETAAEFLQRVLSNPAVGCLIGHNLIKWDRVHMGQALAVEMRHLLELPILDTLLLEAILRPCDRKTLELGGAHTALADAKKTIELFREQLVRLASLPRGTISAWAHSAGPAMSRLLMLVEAHQEELCPDSTVETSTLPLRFLRGLADQLTKLAESERHLLLTPRQLMPAVSALLDRENILIVDAGPGNAGAYNSGPMYIEPPNRGRTTGLVGCRSPGGYRYEDLLLLVDAFVRLARHKEQLPHVCTMNEWAYHLLRTEGVLPFVGASYDAFQPEIASSRSRITLAPLDNLTESALVEELRKRHYSSVVLWGAELGMGGVVVVRTIDARIGQDWQTQRTADGWIMGVNAADQNDMDDIAAWGVTIPAGWRGWVQGTGLDRAEFYMTPTDLPRFVTDLHLGSESPALVEGITLQLPKITIGSLEADKQPADVSQPPAPLSPSTRYRADYFGQVLAGAISQAKEQRILLALSNCPLSSSVLEGTLHGKIYTPTGSRLRRLQKLRKEKHGLIICHLDDLIDWVAVAQPNEMSTPFDQVIIDAWPLDNPQVIPPFTRSELRTLRTISESKDDPEPAADELMNEIIDSPIDAADDSEGDDQDGDAVLWTQETPPTIAQKLLKRLETHAHALGLAAFAAQELSGEPLIVLDSRLAINEQSGLPPYSLQSCLMSYDTETAKAIAQQLRQNGLAGAPKSGNLQLDHEERNKIAHSLFGFDCLHEWQQECLDIILAAERPVGPIAVTATTGGGKSLVYQFPAIVGALHNDLLTLVVTPLRALMQEQCQKLWRSGFVLMADRLSGDMADFENQDVYRRVADGQICVLFVAPERFRSRRFQNVLNARMARDGGLQYWVFDEAHCISLWGHSFRPDYLYAAELANKWRHQYQDNGIAPVLLFTATLPPQVVKDLEDVFPPHDQTTQTN